MSILIGIVGDDFSGSSDAASFFAEKNIKTFLFNGIPENLPLNFEIEDCVAVIALKTRSIQKEEAVKECLDAFNWLHTHGAQKLFFKYCSTFDSTPKGNIGPVVDAVMETYGLPYTILEPGLPVNGRTVENGHLLLSGIPLHKTHMKNHPLNPMWDSFIPCLMKDQGKYPSVLVSRKELYEDSTTLEKKIEDARKKWPHFYVVPDFQKDEDAFQIIRHFGHLDFLTGGSGLNTALADLICSGTKNHSDFIDKKYVCNQESTRKCIILAGSCSVATLSQIRTFLTAYPAKENSFKIDVDQIFCDKDYEAAIKTAIVSSASSPLLIYSSSSADEVCRLQSKYSQDAISKKLESCLAHAALSAFQNGFTHFVAAGGETSGAVTQALSFNSYLVGKSIAPGVPIMYPTDNTKASLILKSGNFGQEDFFIRAIHAAQ